MKRRERDRVERMIELRDQIRQLGPDFFHGGIAGLAEGDLLLPPTNTGTPSTYDYGAHDVCKRDRVYLHTDATHAKMWALLAVGSPGSLYRAEPLDLLEVDPDFNGVGSYSTPSARVLEVLETDVVEWEGLTAEEALKALGAVAA